MTPLPRSTLPWVLAPVLAAAVAGSCVLDSAGGLPVAPGAGGTTSGGAAGAGGTASGGGAVGGAGGSAAAGGTVTTGGGGTGGVTSDCGNGVVETGEDCDDGNPMPADGCTSCSVDGGYACTGEPSNCQPIPPQVASAGPGLAMAITDAEDHYDGTLGTMDCVPLTVADLGFYAVQRVEVTVGVDHPYLGDLIIKVVSPLSTVTAVLSRPGIAEPQDSYYASNGDSSNLVPSHPITFRDDGTYDAETMGSTINQNAAVCRDDQRCDYAPNSGAALGSGLSDFNGENPVGQWRVCFADGYVDDPGSVDRVSLSVLAW